MKKKYSPKKVPMLFSIEWLIAPLARASKHALKAQAQALVPIKYSKIIFHPITKAINSPTVT